MRKLVALLRQNRLPQPVPPLCRPLHGTRDVRDSLKSLTCDTDVHLRIRENWGRAQRDTIDSAYSRSPVKPS